MSQEDDHLLGPLHTLESVTDKIGGLVLREGFDRGWLVAVALASGLVALFCVSAYWLFEVGIGIFGNNVPVAWGWPIINFVWWIGIGHAGTFISAFLVLMRQEWRTSINRYAEAMTLFAVLCAGLYPLLHLGRPMVFYWLFPYPNTMGVWPQVRSPLVWDVFAISTYGTISLLFWYIGLVPDLATLRDRATDRTKKLIYGAMALGWRGDSEQWKHQQTAYLLLAGVATPLVISVHSIVSLDFSVAQLPGWHSTTFPPYFVAGAI
ncbi:MAG: NrfD/PsrC family molybdoenzyme membrane anchor subunit, partial [Bradymonadaceae bacterium]